MNTRRETSRGIKYKNKNVFNTNNTTVTINHDNKKKPNEQYTNTNKTK